MKEGLDKGHDKRQDVITKFEDAANLKAVTLDVSEKILFGLASQYQLSPEDHSAIVSELEEKLTRSIETRPSAVREMAVESIRNTMEQRKIEAPGFRDDYLEELEQKMKVKVA